MTRLTLLFCFFALAAGAQENQEFQVGGSVVNETKSIQRTYFGPSCGFGVRLGEEGKSRIIMGLRDGFGLLGVGKGIPLKFNTITLFAGLEI